VPRTPTARASSVGEGGLDGGQRHRAVGHRRTLSDLLEDGVAIGFARSDDRRELVDTLRQLAR
jgi:hypothetical protein